MVKEGYKETEIGVIPDDWEVKALKNIAPLQRGFDLPYSQMKEGRYPVVFSNGVGAYHARYMVKGPGVVTGRSGTIGKIHYVDNNYWPHNTSLWVTNFHANYPKYIYYLFNTINWELYNSGSGVPTLNRNDIHDLNCAIPPLTEQKCITEALSDMDNLVSSLEKLIEKKKAIKQGAMQELLTGGKQLYSNANELEEIPIKDLFSYINGKSLEEFFNYNSGYKVISIGNYSSEGTFIDTNTYIDHSYKAQFHNLIASNNDLVMILNDKTSIGTILGRVLLIDKDDSYIINQRSVILRLKNDKFCAKYFYYLLNSKYVRKNIMKKSKPGTQIYLNLPDVLELSVKYTSDIKEQQIIANTLSDIDAEIAALEQKLTKCKKLKQGMMQQLLTGKIRLI